MKRRADHFTGSGEGGTGSNRVPQIVEGVLMPIGDSKYLATYIRPEHLKPDAQAEGALRTLCPLK
jgi:hypothetical protein